MNRIAFALIFVWPLVAGAQDPWDDQHQDYEEQDQRYLERLKQAEARQERDPEAERKAFVEMADELIRDQNYRSKVGEHFRVQTDDPRLDVKATSALLETFYHFFDDFWTGRVELQDSDDLSRVFLFYSFYRYNKLLDGDWSLSWNRPRGHYTPEFDTITVHTDAATEDSFADTLIHEATHQLVQQRIYGSGDVGPSLWVTEGLADYFGYTYMDRRHEFHAGEIGGKKVALLRDDAGASKESKDILSAFRKALRKLEKQEPVHLTSVVYLDDPRDFYGEGANLNYFSSWLLVHFMLHADEGRHAPAFQRYLALEESGAEREGALFRELGLEREQLDAALLAYLKGLKAH
jgi:hypothetical protein